MRLRDYPYVIVRFACRHCPRMGRYRVAVLAERYGADVDMEDVLEAVSSSCRARSGARGVTCGRRTCRRRCCRGNGSKSSGAGGDECGLLAAATIACIRGKM